MMGAIMTLSFANEARMNFLGHKLIEGWDERQTIKAKVKEVAKKLGTSANFGSRPYSTIMQVKEFRDILAHGKPDFENTTLEKIVTQAEVDQYNVLQSKWQRFMTLEFIQRAYADLDEVLQGLFKLTGLSDFEGLTHGGRSIQFIEYVDGEEDNAPSPSASV